MDQFFFYLFGSILTLAAIGVVTAKNSVHSVLLLILCFFNAAWLLINLNAEFLAMMLIIIYVGAVAVLFLFVVMMLDDHAKLTSSPRGMSKVTSFLFASLFFLELCLMFVSAQTAVAPSVFPEFSITQIGNILYTEHFVSFQIMGLILFVAMVGAIAITLTDDKNTFTKKQNVSNQVNRSPADSIEIVKVDFKKGVDFLG